MTAEVLPCCCAVSPCPCYQTTGGYRITWTGIIRHDPVGCACLLGVTLPPGYSGPIVEEYTLRTSFQSGVPAFDRLWIQPTTGNPAPCGFPSLPAVLYGTSRPMDFYELGLGGYCVGPQNTSISTLSFSMAASLIPYRPTLNQKWRVELTPWPFRLVFESDSTNCDPTGFTLVSSTVVPFPDNGTAQPFSVNCHGLATQGIVSSTLVSEGTVSVVRI